MVDELFAFDCPVGAAMAIMHKNRFLVCERQHCRDFNGRWQFPGGGVKIHHETPLQAAIREVKEETGKALSEGYTGYQYIGVSVVTVPRLYIAHFFLWHIKARRHRHEFVQTEPDKHGPWEWVHYDDLLANRSKRPIMPGMQPILLSFKSADAEAALR